MRGCVKGEETRACGVACSLWKSPWELLLGVLHMDLERDRVEDGRTPYEAKKLQGLYGAETGTVRFCYTWRSSVGGSRGVIAVEIDFVYGTMGRRAQVDE